MNLRVMGLGRGQLSIMDQLVDKSVIDDSFSLCYGGMDVGGGAMVLGKITPPPDMVFTHSDPFRRYTSLTGLYLLDAFLTKNASNSSYILTVAFECQQPLLQH